MIGYKALKNLQTGEVTILSPVYLEDFPYRQVDPGQFLLRYLDFWKFEDLLRTGELYLCRADKFEDPLEGALSPPHIHGTSKTEKAFEKNAKYVDGHYQRMQEYRPTAKGTTFVSCWHMNDGECPLMWKRYTEGPDSVVLVTRAGDLMNSLGKPLFGSPVRYVTQDQPRVEFDERSLFYYKDIEFKYEKEFRLVYEPLLFGETSIFRNKPEDFYRRVSVDFSKLNYGINTHPEATSETKKKLDALARKFLPNSKKAV